LEIAHRAYVFGIGEIIHQGQSKELLNNKTVLNGFLGV
jgi:ABC-type branched-subunit amino acid transport system ATPase component